MTALLPESRIDRSQIRNMKIGEKRYTVAWAMTVRLDLTCYLCGTYTTSHTPGGTAKMLITRKDDGFYVSLPSGESYIPTDDIPWVGGTSGDLIPVQGFL